MIITKHRLSSILKVTFRIIQKSDKHNNSKAGLNFRAVRIIRQQVQYKEGILLQPLRLNIFD